MNVVLDSFAVLALLKGEPAAARVGQLVEDGAALTVLATAALGSGSRP